jgi:hypothetical protein
MKEHTSPCLGLELPQLFSCGKEHEDKKEQFGSQIQLSTKATEFSFENVFCFKLRFQPLLLMILSQDAMKLFDFLRWGRM